MTTVIVDVSSYLAGILFLFFLLAMLLASLLAGPVDKMLLRHIQEGAGNPDRRTYLENGRNQILEFRRKIVRSGLLVLLGSVTAFAVYYSLSTDYLPGSQQINPFSFLKYFSF